ncbi:5-oxoprolinase subunit C family protein [Lutispora saccharofermentans]|uniref:Biotin-dependent carboxyltransferase family protein n=1 Tax=Lutispora saccharofermentans TaxID=3024236 RepID=A0ABT1NH97_9FIRM|nr:biotin-dependent carboxyltransferase family protein [Lutispora saccharofermentans]MCQ1530627.1 biotin-dependent carboxyltransferase family protein [Lutispora saccharofermentans]
MGMIKMLKPGLFTTVQDSGRTGLQRYGIPVAGAMDDFSFRIANILVGNDENTAALETTFMGPSIQMEFNGYIAITGANMEPRLNGNKVHMWRSIEVSKGDSLTFSGASEGLRSYIAFGGGIGVPAILGSRSTYVRGSLGGYNGRKLMEGDEVPIDLANSKAEAGKYISPGYIPRFNKNNVVRVVLGPQDDHFSSEMIETFLKSEYKITAEADRMGYRLEGPTLTHVKGPDIISDGIAFGSVQVPGHGSPIIMMADRQTTGGYTKIATVIWADLPLLAQMGPGDAVHFQAVTIEEGQDIFAQYEENIKNIKFRIENSHIIQEEAKTYNVTINKK